MKVIKERKWSFRLRCPCCRSLLEIHEEDVRFWRSEYRDDSGFDVHCVCGEQPDLKDEQIPSSVKEKAISRWRANRNEQS